MTRKQFLFGGSTLAAGGVIRGGAAAPADAAPAAFAAGEPVLQTPDADSIGVVWSVNRRATGFVEIAESPDLAHARTVKTGCLPLAGYDDRVLSARIDGLRPATRYWYRTVTQEIVRDPAGGYARIHPGVRAVGTVHSFATAGAAAASRFCVINDTHACWKSFRLTAARLRELAPPVAVWNGDALNCTEERETAVRTFLEPDIPTRDVFSGIPFLWTNGNHDYEGLYAPRLADVVLPRRAGERAPRFAALARNFAVRQGEIALIGLDTGEGIHDADTRLCGLGSFSAYRALQAEWLGEALAKPEIASAPFAVAFCHIPLWNTGENPFGCWEPREKGCASWIRECYESWGPVLDAHRVQLVVCGHEHCHRWDEEIPRFGWKQVLGGGPELTIPQWGEKGKKYYPTIIEGLVENGRLVVRTHDAWRRTVVDERIFARRRTP